MIFVIGSINLDLVTRVKTLPQPGETVTGHGFERLPGGKGANQALAVLRAGGDLSFHGAVGDDAFAELALSELASAGADLTPIARTTAPTGTASILVAENGQNMIAVVPGANGEVRAAMAERALAKAGPKDMLLLQQEIPGPANKAALTAARNAGVKSILNIAPFSDDTPELAALADIVIANETEFADLSGTSPASHEGYRAAIAAWAQKNGQTIVVSLGADGVIAATGEGEVHSAKGLDITPVDTVGAGDTFCGYFAAALHKGNDLQTALSRAAIAGSLACLKPGAQAAIPHAVEVERALRP